MASFSIEPRKKKCQRIWIFVIHTKSIWATKTGLDTVKTASKKGVHKTAENCGTKICT